LAGVQEAIFTFEADDGPITLSNNVLGTREFTTAESFNSTLWLDSGSKLLTSDSITPRTLNQTIMPLANNSEKP